MSGTKNEEKIQSIKEGVQILEDFLEKFETENLIKNNRAYLAYTVIEQLPAPEDDLQIEFLNAYGGPKAKGNYKHLRTMYPNDDDSFSWDIVRNRNINKLMAKLKEEEAKLFDEEGKPTDIHLQLIYWAYSPQPDKVKNYVGSIKKDSTPPPPQAEKKAEKRKCEETDSDTASECSDKDEADHKEEENGESPAKKAKTA